MLIMWVCLCVGMEAKKGQKKLTKDVIPLNSCNWNNLSWKNQSISINVGWIPLFEGFISSFAISKTFFSLQIGNFSFLILFYLRSEITD